MLNIRFKIFFFKCLNNIIAKNANVVDLKNEFEKQVNEILQERNSFFKVPKLYKLIAERIEEAQKKKKILISCERRNDTCYSFLQDMGLLLFNRNTQMVCIDPQLIAKALAVFVMPPNHEAVIFANVPPSIKELSILPHQLVKDRIIQAKIATDENILEVIECLQQFDFCYKLNEEEEKMYGSKDKPLSGYLFPSMRKPAPLSLRIPQADEKLLTLGILFERDDYAIGSNFFFRLQVIAR